MTAQVPHIAITAMPKPSRNLFMLTIDLPGTRAGRPRSIDYVIDQASAQQLLNLRRSRQYSSKFCLAPNGERAQFLNVESVRFDLVAEPGHQVFSPAQIRAIRQLNL